MLGMVPTAGIKINDFFPTEWIVRQCEDSLKNLQVERLDILYLHTWNASWAHHTKWYETMNKLKEQGKIRAIGISISDKRIAEANVAIEAGRVDVIECVYIIFEQEPECTLFPLARKHNVAIVARCPFSSGALIGNWTLDTVFPEGDWRIIWPSEFG